jgi:DUF1365 family protein
MPLLTLGVIARIHWQALRLMLKRVPFFGKHGSADLPAVPPRMAPVAAAHTIAHTAPPR